MSTKSTTASRSRELLKGLDMGVAPGAYDAITARLIERAGLPAVYMTGAGAAASQGFPDYGLVTMSEMVAAIEAMARSISIPLIADADTGYGNELNVVRSVAEYESKVEITIDLESQTVALPGLAPKSFNIDAFRKECLLEGVDDIDLTRRHLNTIERFEANHFQDGIVKMTS